MTDYATWEDMIHVSTHMRKDDFDEVMATRWDDSPYSFAAEHMKLNGPKYVVRNSEGEPTVIGGIAVHQPGVGQVWLVASNGIKQCKIEVAKVAQSVIDYYMQKIDESLRLHRLQAFSAESHTMAHRWLKKMGFRQESTLPAFGKHGENFLVFSIVKGN